MVEEAAGVPIYCGQSLVSAPAFAAAGCASVPSAGAVAAAFVPVPVGALHQRASFVVAAPADSASRRVSAPPGPASAAVAESAADVFVQAAGQQLHSLSAAQKGDGRASAAGLQVPVAVAAVHCWQEDGPR